MKRAQTCWYWTSVFQRYGNWCVNPTIDMTRQNRLSQTPTLRLFSCSSLWYVPAFGEQQPITNPALSIASFPRVILCSNTHSEMKIDDIEPLLVTNLRHFGVGDITGHIPRSHPLCRGMPEASWPGALLRELRGVCFACDQFSQWNKRSESSFRSKLVTKRFEEWVSSVLKRV